MKISIISFSDTGAKLVEKIITLTDDEYTVFDQSFKEARNWIQREFFTCDAFIFVGATGIAIRYIAKLLVSKDKDPAIIVIDELGKFTIPILSGHIGGANALALKLASLLNSTPVITTATDLNNKFAVDAWSTEQGAVIDNISCIKTVSAKILKNEKIAFTSDFSGSATLPDELYFANKGETGICVSLDTTKKPFNNTLKVMPKILTLGVGCRKNTLVDAFENFILAELKKHHFSLKAVKAIASIDLKKDEECILAFSQKYKIPFTTFTGEELNSVKGDFTSSAFVKSITSVDNVCERSAVLKSEGTLLTKKEAKDGVTLAIAKTDWEYKF